MTRYALIEVDHLGDEGDEALHVPRLHGVYDELEEALKIVRTDQRGLFVATDPETGEREEWNSRTHGECIAVLIEEVLATTSLVVADSTTRGVYRIFQVSPKGRRFPTHFYVHDTRVA